MRAYLASEAKYFQKSIRTYTYKLLDKAEANINAVAEGKFVLGVYRTGDKE